jgi:hypothetical protein
MREISNWSKYKHKHKMKKILIVLLNTFIITSSYAQENQYFLVKLAIENNSILNQNQNYSSRELLYKNLTKICNKVEGVIIDENSDYYLITDVYSNESKTSNAGFLPVGSFKMELKLKLVYKNGGKTFSEINFSKGYISNTESEATQKIVSDFNFSDKELIAFFKDGFLKMKKYYSENCNSIIDVVKKYQSVGEPEKALAICLSIPSDQSCYNTISSLSKELYTSLSYKSDYSIFLKAQDLVSKGDYDNAFYTLNKISIYSQFYLNAQNLGKQINDFIFNQKELQKKKELAVSEQNLKETEIALQQKRNELQVSINQTNIEIENQKNESDRMIAAENLENQKQMKSMELQSQERKEMIKTAGNLLGAYIKRPQPPQNTNFYIIK